MHIARTIAKEIRVEGYSRGEKVFAAELDTQAMPNCPDDLHRASISEIPKKAVKLDNSLEEACLKIMYMLDLKYGAFDFILDEKNQLYFLEIIRQGTGIGLSMIPKCPLLTRWLA